VHKTRQNLCRIVDKIDVLLEVDGHTEHVLIRCQS